MELIFDPAKSGKRMKIACFVSGSGTNYREIVKRGPDHDYLVFTNRPGCGGTEIARENRHTVVELSHAPYLRGAREKYGAGNVPRNCPERVKFEQEVAARVEDKIGGKPDLVCLAGYDQWLTDWMVDRYFPRMLNVHPGDTTLGYDGLYWIPSAKAIIAGDTAIRSTLFVVDNGEDTGPVLAQSAPLNIMLTLDEIQADGITGITDRFNHLRKFISERNIKNYSEFTDKADIRLASSMEDICRRLQDRLKVAGDWQIYPFAVHDLIAKGRAGIEGRKIFVDGREMPVFGWRMV
jgi:folate-dependent phosphoribosylglycinamide formyltransferase PurN